MQSRYCVYVFLNHGCVFAASRLQHSVAVDITASEAFGFSIAAIMAEIVRGYLEDLGMASATAQATPIVTDNDATMRIASGCTPRSRAPRCAYGLSSWSSIPLRAVAARCALRAGRLERAAQRSQLAGIGCTLHARTFAPKTDLTSLWANVGKLTHGLVA